MGFTLGFSRPLGDFWLSMAIISGSTHTMLMTLACFSTRPSSFRSRGTTPKLAGFSVRASVPNYHGLTAFVVLSGVNSRFFEPQVGGLGTDFTTEGVFRIDHDQKFQQTTHLQYQPKKRGRGSL
jgi:hypothetical protein